jgi:RNA polymerase sigma-70 factor (ECF subfamily)
MEHSDHELMARLAEGEDAALNELMDRWGGRVAAFLHRLTGQREVAADLAQETFVNLYQARERYRPRGNFSTYLFSIASNLARNHARWNRRHPTVSSAAGPDADEGTVNQLADPAPTPDEAARAAERFRAVHAAFLLLPTELREAMSLFVYEGLGYADIAAIAQCSPKAVETRIYRARQLLKEHLREHLT